MKHHIGGIVKLIVLIIACFVMLCISSCKQSDSDIDTTNTSEQASEVPSTAEIAPDITLASDGKTEYIVVRGDNAPDWETNAAIFFRKTFNAVTGSSIGITTDFDFNGSQKHAEKEILIGHTNREGDEFTLDRESFGYGGFAVLCVGEKIVITASNESGLYNAIEYFFSEFAGITDIYAESLKTTNIICIPGGYSHMDSRVLTKENMFDIADKKDLVAICYSTWFNPIIEGSAGNPANIAEVLEGKRDWGGVGEFHYWSEPALGYYKSSDKAVIRTHMTQLAEAGIDFIIIDNTNVSTDWKNGPYYNAFEGKNYPYWDGMVSVPCTALLDTVVEMRAEGLKTPYVVMWCRVAGDYSVVDAIYEEFYTNEKYDTCWVYWDEKPFFIVTDLAGKREDITLRKMWGLRPQLTEEWSFLNVPNQVAYAADGSAEQICVCVAAQQSYMSLPTATGRRGGLTFYEQWCRAFDARPKIVTLTWWNEWAAQRFVDAAGNSRFVDNYTPEYSRDIEPMKGGHGDTYYNWMKQYISAYKSGNQCPKLISE